MEARTGAAQKNQRINIRVSARQKSMLKKAARLQQTTISDFVLENAVKAAQEMIEQRKLADQTHFALPETEFDRQKRLFFAISEAERTRYNGQFVASFNGAIVDSDSELAVLTRRFFALYGDVSVYITKVGEPIRATISTPFFK